MNRFTSSTKYYIIDYWLSQYKIAIEIDENNHADRNVIDEKQRQKALTTKLNCKFLRCNPDDPDFTVYRLLGNLTNMLITKP